MGLSQAGRKWAITAILHCRFPSNPGLKLVRHLHLRYLLIKSYNMENRKTPHRLGKNELVFCDMMMKNFTRKHQWHENSAFAMSIGKFGHMVSYFSLIPLIVLLWENTLSFSGVIWNIWEYTGKWCQVYLGSCLSSPLSYCKIQFIWVTYLEMVFEHREFEVLFSVTDSSRWSWLLPSSKVASSSTGQSWKGNSVQNNRKKSFLPFKKSCFQVPVMGLEYLPKKSFITVSQVSFMAKIRCFLLDRFIFCSGTSLWQGARLNLCVLHTKLRAPVHIWHIWLTWPKANAALCC